MPSTDLDHLLRQTSPEVQVPSAAGPAMAATARSITNGERRPLRSTRRARRVVLAGGLAAVCAGTAWLGTTDPGSTPETDVVRATDLRLVAEKLAPSSLPLPDGVTMDDATAHVAGLLKANPALESKGSYVLDRGIVGSVGSQLSVPAEETGVSASYVFYARCQWQRVMLDGQVDSDTGMAALDRLADSAAFAADDMGVHAVEHEGVGAVPADTEAVRRDFETNCSHGFGDAPGAR